MHIHSTVFVNYMVCVRPTVGSEDAGMDGVRPLPPSLGTHVCISLLGSQNTTDWKLKQQMLIFSQF